MTGYSDDSSYDPTDDNTTYELIDVTSDDDDFILEDVEASAEETTTYGFVAIPDSVQALNTTQV